MLRIVSLVILAAVAFLFLWIIILFRLYIGLVEIVIILLAVLGLFAAQSIFKKKESNA